VNETAGEQFDLDQTFIARLGLEVTHAPDGCVIYDAANEKVHYLNPTAGVVFELCDGVNSTRTIADFLNIAYALDAAPLESVRDCLVSLLDQGLVAPCPKSSPGA
jgi:coenzyme PQQ synthesis protein D (PqqD)